MCGKMNGLTLADVEDALKEVQANLDARQDQWTLDIHEHTPVSCKTGSTVAAIAVSDEGRLNPACFTWGFSFPWSDRPIINTRWEKACGVQGIWPAVAAGALDSRTGRPTSGRCLVPAVSFHERNSRGRSFDGGVPRGCYFSDPDRLLMLAAVYGEDRLSIVTQPSNHVVGAIHDRMPLVLSPRQAQVWLSDGWRQLSMGEAAPQASSSPKVCTPEWTKPLQLSLF